MHLCSILPSVRWQVLEDFFNFLPTGELRAVLLSRDAAFSELLERRTFIESKLEKYRAELESRLRYIGCRG